MENNELNNDVDSIQLIDKILLNLKMLSLIKPDDKLYTENNLIKIDSPKIIQGILRWINDYSRSNTMDDIDKLISDTTQYVNDTLAKNKRTADDNRNCQKILVEITKAFTGIQNLKITYKNDTFIQSKLDIINEKMLEIKNELSKKLQVKE
jgi:hypothetical protein